MDFHDSFSVMTGLSSYTRRHFAPLLPAIEAESESEASKCAPVPTASQLRVHSV